MSTMARNKNKQEVIVDLADPTEVAKAVTRDYSGLMKAINKKKGL